MTSGARRGRERRWVVVAPDGRFVSLGRGSDPTEDEILIAEAQLAAQGLAGWLAVMEGNPHVGAIPKLVVVRELAHPTASFTAATEAFTARVMALRAAGDREAKSVPDDEGAGG